MRGDPGSKRSIAAGALNHVTAADLDAAVLKILTKCAAEGKPCPTNQAIGDRVGINWPATISKSIRRLAATGLIHVETARNFRYVTILLTGQRTTDRVLKYRRRGPSITRSMPEPFEADQPEPITLPPPRILPFERRTCRRCGSAITYERGCGHHPPLSALEAAA